MTKIQELAKKIKDIANRSIPNERRCDKEYHLLSTLIDELAGIAEAPLVVNTIKDIPADRDSDDNSENYLIDLNGFRTDFSIGHYDHYNKRWIIHDDGKRTMFEPEHMTWQRLPLAKYDKK